MTLRNALIATAGTINILGFAYFAASTPVHWFPLLMLTSYMMGKGWVTYLR